eukprot:TRINITY_DN10261_c0_g1_i1.p1 TRINITY_DN10261_c0_g1~~TRINITY_DN10261_c0_g1_i1.p1  ORF type:complete len:218 (-),score=48.08 TRINITY_DN10261_c0_g1_i1:60-713(-)
MSEIESVDSTNVTPVSTPETQIIGSNQNTGVVSLNAAQEIEIEEDAKHRDIGATSPAQKRELIITINETKDNTNDQKEEETITTITVNETKETSKVQKDEVTSTETIELKGIPLPEIITESIFEAYIPEPQLPPDCQQEEEIGVNGKDYKKVKEQKEIWQTNFYLFKKALAENDKVAAAHILINTKKQLYEDPLVDIYGRSMLFSYFLQSRLKMRLN